MSSDIPVHPELGTVVVGVDGSPSAGKAALWAAEEAARRGQSLCLVHAADTDWRAPFVRVETLQAVREAGRNLLDETAAAIRKHHPDLNVVKELSKLEPVAALSATAGRRGTIVVGNRGLGGFAALMLGSVGLGVAAHANVPVIVVREDGDRSRTGTVVAAVHGASDLNWLGVAAAEAEARKASLELVSVWNVLTQVGSVATMISDLDELAQTRVREVGEMADLVRRANPELAVSHHVETGTSTPGTLVDASAGTDLLVMGREHRALGVGPAIGRVTHAVLHHARCPVQIVPSDFTPWEHREDAE